MEFRIADTFTDSLGRLSAEEQKAVKTTAFDLQVNPSSPGLQFHKLEKAKDKRFWSVRVSRDIRIIVHRSSESLLLCFVGHHDKAYDWAERRRLETHPRTGAAQFVEIRETVQDIVVPAMAAAESRPPKPLLFAGRADDELLSYGVPPEWLQDVRRADEDSLFTLADHLPAEAAEALLELATGGQPRRPASEPVRATQRQLPADESAAAAELAAFAHPDAQRRFRLISTPEELERALEYPWEKWTVFLHPEQREWLGADYSGPARVSGSAGTGKTIVALHRAAFLARKDPEARVLLATFSDTLAHALRTKLRRLIGSEPRLAERLEVEAMDALGLRLHKSLIGPVKLANRQEVVALLRKCPPADQPFSLRFLIAEWEHIVDAWQLKTWEAYRDVARLGRKTRLPEAQRRALWATFEGVWTELRERGLKTSAGVFEALAESIAKGRHSPYDYAVIDEAQDLSVTQLKFLAALGGNRPNALFFAGDLGQRIFRQPFSWKSLGVDVRGRSRTLRVNYRTSHQIRLQADRLLSPEVADADGNREIRTETVSVFNGPAPVFGRYASETEERDAVAKWLAARFADGVQPHEIAVFVRSPAEMPRAEGAVKDAGLAYRVLDDQVQTATGFVSVCTMHLAKGLEFKAVVVMACDDEVIPSQERIQEVGDDTDLQEIYDTERHLLYVACTRARDYLLVTGVEPTSEFIEDMEG